MKIVLDFDDIVFNAYRLPNDFQGVYKKPILKSEEVFLVVRYVPLLIIFFMII